jgi:hypothetical protein
MKKEYRFEKLEPHIQNLIANNLRKALPKLTMPEIYRLLRKDKTKYSITGRNLDLLETREVE